MSFQIIYNANTKKIKPNNVAKINNVPKGKKLIRPNRYIDNKDNRMKLQFVKSVVPLPEIKVFDFDAFIQPTTVVNTFWGAHHITNMVQGTGYNNRVGNRIKIISIDFRMIFVLNSQAVSINTFGDQVRVCIIQDTQANGSTIGAGQVFEENGIRSFQNHVTNKRFIRLADKISKPLNANLFDTIGLVSTVQSLNLHYSNEPIEVRYLSNSGNQGSVEKNSIWIFWAGIHGVSSMGYSARIRFVDY